MRSVKCSCLKADGTPCLAPAMRGAEVCFFHATNDQVKAAEKRQGDELDIASELKKQLRRAKRLPPSIEKSKLMLEITKAIRDAEGGKAEEAETAKKPAKKALL